MAAEKEGAPLAEVSDAAMEKKVIFAAVCLGC